MSIIKLESRNLPEGSNTNKKTLVKGNWSPCRDLNSWHPQYKIQVLQVTNVTTVYKDAPVRHSPT